MRIDKLLSELFCDYSFKKDFLYSQSGLALIGCYHCNPVRILRVGIQYILCPYAEASPPYPDADA